MRIRRHFSSLKLLPVLSLAALSGSLILGIVPSAALQTQAGLNASDNVAATQKYCKSKLPKSVQSNCTANNMNQIRALFTDECNGNGPTDCVENHAEGVIDDIAKAKPKTDSDFNDAFKEALSDNGADNKGGSLATTGDQSPIDAGSLPTPTANSGTI